MHMSLVFSNLVVSNLLGHKIIVMCTFITKFRKILEISKQYAGNQVSDRGNVPCRGVVGNHGTLLPLWYFC